VSVAAKRSLFTAESMLRVLSAWHWIFAIIGVGLVIGFYKEPPARYGWGAMIFAFGLIWPEQWLKRQIGAPPTPPIQGG